MNHIDQRQSHTFHLLFIDKQRRHAHPGAHTHTRQQDLFLLTATLAQTRNNLPHARHAKRMAKSNRASARIELFPIEFELVAAVDCHGSESLVDLDDVDVVVEREVVPVCKISTDAPRLDMSRGIPFEEFWNSIHRSNAHDSRSKT